MGWLDLHQFLGFDDAGWMVHNGYEDRGGIPHGYSCDIAYDGDGLLAEIARSSTSTTLPLRVVYSHTDGIVSSAQFFSGKRYPDSGWSLAYNLRRTFDTASGRVREEEYDGSDTLLESIEYPLSEFDRDREYTFHDDFAVSFTMPDLYHFFGYKRRESIVPERLGDTPLVRDPTKASTTQEDVVLVGGQFGGWHGTIANTYVITYDELGRIVRCDQYARPAEP